MHGAHVDSLARWISLRLPRRSLFGLLAAMAVAGEIWDEAESKKRRAANRHARHKRRDRNFRLKSLIPEVQGEIVGGTAVPQGVHTFATYVEIDLGEEGVFACTGSLITPRHVLTAAHCVVDDSDEVYAPSVFLTVIGRASIEDGTVPQANFRRVAAVFKHPDYDSFTLRNDVAVLQLQGDVPASLAQPVALVGSNDTRFDSPGQSATVAGWGRTSGGGPSSSQLLQARLSVLSDAACAAEIELEPDVHICASAARAISCNGDSGGPLFVTAVAAASEPGTVRAEQRGLVEAEKKKRRKRRKNRGATPVPVPPPPPAAAQPVSPPASPPPPPPLPTIATQLGIVSYGLEGCPVDTADVYTQLSAPEVRNFVTQITGI